MRILRSVLMLGLASSGAFAADLQLQVEALPGSSVRVGEPVTLRYTLTNLGPDASPSASVLVTWNDLPLPTAYTCPHSVIVARAEAGTGAATQVLEFGDTAAGASESCDILLPGLQAGTYPIPARTSSQIDPNPTNNSANISLMAYTPGTPVPVLGGRTSVLLSLIVLLIGLRIRNRDG